MVLFHNNCITVKIITEQIVYPILVFAVNFKVLKSESKQDRKITK